MCNLRMSTGDRIYIVLMTLTTMMSFCRALLQCQYKIEHIYAPYRRLEHNEPLHRVLYEIDPVTFPSLSQSRRAIEYGKLLVLRANDSPLDTSTLGGMNLDSVFRSDGVVADSSLTLCNGDVIALRSRLENSFYPQSCTKYVDPPIDIIDDFLAVNNPVLFEDDHIAIVNKPGGLDCIGEKRNDLQSILPFVLRPPDSITKKNLTKQCYLPRPVHRLDRKTCGCVLVAKSKNAMRHFSHLFASRQVQKSYCAITFGEPSPSEEDNTVTTVNGKDYNIVDYPIDGKDAVTFWRTVSTVTTQTYGKLSLLHCLPKTGRNHQIRRHLSYCLNTPIVGDNKYDGGKELGKESRKLGMFLCSNRITFEHMMDKGIVDIEIPIPNPFLELLELEQQEVVI